MACEDGDAVMDAVPVVVAEGELVPVTEGVAERVGVAMILPEAVMEALTPSGSEPVAVALTDAVMDAVEVPDEVDVAVALREGGGGKRGCVVWMVGVAVCPYNI